MTPTGLTSEPSAEPSVEVDHNLGWADRLLPGLLLGSIGLGLAIGLTIPSLGNLLSQGVAVGVFCLIYVVMLGVGPNGLGTVMGAPRFVAIAVVLNFVVNPILAWALGATMLADSAELRAGLLLFLVTPCVGWFLVFTDLAGGDTALGVGLLGVNLVLQIALLPLYLAIFVGDSVGVPIATVVRSVVIFLVGPAILAAGTRRWMRRYESDAGPRLQRRASAVKAILLSTVIVSMFASHAHLIVDNSTVLLQLVAPLVVFFALAFALALAVGRQAGMSPRRVALLAFTTTSRNSEASLAIAATAFASPLVGLTVVLGPVVELPLLVLMVRVLNRRR